jgi:type IV pilus assembly protein PilA
MNKKGFTLVELLATIVIMGIIIAIAVPSYIHITQSTKEKAYESKKEYIEAKAISYASENDLDPATITVADLINAGYIEADSDGKFSNPKGGYLDCYQITITKNNGEYTAELTSVEAGNCTVTDNNNLNIMAYPYNLANSTLGVKIEADNWTNQDVILYVDLTALSNKNIKSIKWTSGTIDDNKTIDKDHPITNGVSIDFNKYCNEEKVSASVFLNSKYIVEVTLDDGTVKTGSYTVKIDKEKPVVTGNVDNTWTNGNKKITLNGSDGDGSGISGYYVSNGDIIPDQSNFTSDNTSTHGTGTYNAYAIDKAGNISEKFLINISNIDTDMPVCRDPIDMPWTNNDVYLNYGCSSDSSTGCAEKNKNITSGPYSSEETKNIEWTIYDNVGNSFSCTKEKFHIKIDKTNPTCLLAEVPSNWTKNAVSITYGCQDSQSGCKTSPITETFNSYTNKELKWTIYDNVGNKTSCSQNIEVKIDKTPPVCVSSGGNTTPTPGPVVIKGTCTDNESGCTGDVSKTYTDKINSTTESPGTVYDNAGNSTVCPNQSVHIGTITSTKKYTIFTSGSNPYVRLEHNVPYYNAYEDLKTRAAFNTTTPGTPNYVDYKIYIAKDPDNNIASLDNIKIYVEERSYVNANSGKATAASGYYVYFDDGTMNNPIIKGKLSCTCPGCSICGLDQYNSIVSKSATLTAANYDLTGHEYIVVRIYSSAYVYYNYINDYSYVYAMNTWKITATYNYYG